MASPSAGRRHPDTRIEQTLAVSTLGDYSSDNDFISDYVTGLAADGTLKIEPVTFDSPPDWLTTDGQITLPGLYYTIILVTTDDAFTDTSKLVLAYSPFNVHATSSVSAFLFGGGLSVGDAVALGPDDVPYQLNVGVKAQTDVTGTLRARVEAVRLAY